MLALIGVAFAQEVDVVVARRRLEPGLAIQLEDLSVVKLDPAQVPEHTFRSVDDVVGRVPTRPVFPSSFVRAERLVDGAGLDVLSPSGARRVRVLLPAPSRVVQPLDFVDVVRVDAGGVCLLATAYVIAGERDGGELDTRLDDGAGLYVAVHLAVEPADADLVGVTPSSDVALWLRNRAHVSPATTPSCRR